MPGGLTYLALSRVVPDVFPEEAVLSVGMRWGQRAAVAFLAAALVSVGWTIISQRRASKR